MIFLNKFKSLRASFYAIIFACIFSFSSVNTFAHFGPRGPFGGNVSCFTSFNGIVYVGTQNGGVFESTNSDIVSWRARPVGLKSGKITALVHSGNYLFAGTADSGIFIFNGYIGTDRYWNKINNGLSNLKIKSLVAVDSITIIAGTEGNGLFKTTDKGATWNAINSSSLNNSTITSFQNTGTRIFALALNKGVFVSDNNGNTWADFNDANTLNISSSTIMSYNAQTDELLVKNQTGIFVSSPVNAVSSIPNFISMQANIPLSYNIHNIVNIETDWFLSSDFGVFTTNTNLLTWTAINTGLPNNFTTSIIVSDSNLVLGIKDLGIYKSKLGTYNWTEMNTNFNNIATKTMITSGDSLVIAVTDLGVHVSKNLLPNYTISNNGLTDFANINDIIIGNGNLYAATKNGGVFMSTDLGANWSAINTGLSNLNITKLFYGNNEMYLFDNMDSIYQSQLNTINWKSKNGKLPKGTIPTSMTFIGIHSYLSTNMGVFSSFGGYFMSWFDTNNGLTNLDVTSITSQGESLFAGTNGSGVFVKHEGKDWEATSPTSISHTNIMNLDGSKIQAMGYYKGYVYASYKGGLLTTSDSGTTWIAGGNQFNLPSFTDVNKISFVTSRVYVSTENNGLYSNSLSELSPLPDFLNVSDSIVFTGFASNNDDVYKIWVNSNVEWTVTSDQVWMTVDTNKGKYDGFFNIIMKPGNTGVERTGNITVTGGTETKIIKVTQTNMPLSVQPINNINSSLNLYPNPSNGNINIEFNDADIEVQKISLYDISGKLLKENFFQNNSFNGNLNVDYPSGVYMLNVHTNKGTATQKILIK